MTDMYPVLNDQGLKRVANLLLERHKPQSREDALRYLNRGMGAYDRDGLMLRAHVDAFFRNSAAGA
ncbi:hypothetical protein [Yunchengibacter salinarum]|uniref:hypothetical protein n=1 Tax=Yunchengibacter salinarum TaxID=3133399 RepID=UPI0035B5F53D